MWSNNSKRGEERSRTEATRTTRECVECHRRISSKRSVTIWRNNFNRWGSGAECSREKRNSGRGGQMPSQEGRFDWPHPHSLNVFWCPKRLENLCLVVHGLFSPSLPENVRYCLCLLVQTVTSWGACAPLHFICGTTANYKEVNMYTCTPQETKNLVQGRKKFGHRLNHLPPLVFIIIVFTI